MNLIDKYEAYKLISHEAMASLLSDVKVAYERAAMLVDQMPTVDAEPVRHGTWEYYAGAARCTACDRWCGNERYCIDYLYCPYCGAEMR